MKMDIKEIANKKEWQDFYNKFSRETFLQSWEWGELQKAIGYKILRLGIFDGKNLVGILLVIKIRASRGSFLFVPHGPIIKPGIAFIKQVVTYLKIVAKKEGFSWIRISPILENNTKNRKIFQKEGFRDSPIHMHAEIVWMLDIENDENDILASMRKTTRYLVRKAEKEEVVIEKSQDKAAVSKFWSVYKKTAERENFTPFSKNFILEEFNAFNREENAVFLLGRTKDSKKILASALVIFNKTSGFYHQGASLHSKVPVSYLMQWEAIKEAKKRGCTLYNFWGVSAEDDINHPWHGLSLFKRGFGGRQVDYLHAQDFVVSPLFYYATYVYEKLLRWKRGL